MHCRHQQTRTDYVCLFWQEECVPQPVQQNLCSGDHCAGSDSGRHVIELAPDAAASCSAVIGPAASLSPMLSLARTYRTCVPPPCQVVGCTVSRRAASHCVQPLVWYEHIDTPTCWDFGYRK